MDFNPHHTVVRLSVHNSSWRPPGRPGALGRSKSDKNKSSLLQRKLNKSYQKIFFPNFTKMLFFSSLLSTATATAQLDLGKNGLEGGGGEGGEGGEIGKRGGLVLYNQRDKEVTKH